ncbi:MAG: hypothetical protein AMXMBFR23_07460 [Chloroflexota bacterium]
MSRLRTRAPIVIAVLLCVLVLVIDQRSDGGLHLVAWNFLGVSHDAWGLMGTILAVAFATQMVLNSRSALHRERRLVRTAAQLREVSAELDRLARTDPLTGILNRRAFFDLLGLEFRRSKRYSRHLSVLMLDLDNFKRVNDQWGHPFGDYVLQATAHVIAANVRESDILGRYGGEEFALALPETARDQAVVVGEKLRQALEAFEFRSDGLPSADGPPLKMTISIGVSAMPVEVDQDEFELIHRADRALYEAKRSGKNQVVFFGQGTVSRGAPASAGPRESA